MSYLPMPISISKERINRWLTSSESLLDKQAIVYNCIANRNHTDTDESFFSNYLIPREIMKRESEKIERWAQFGSYYEEYFEYTGKHLNEYSKYKTIFSYELCDQSDFKVLNLRLPHIFSVNELSSRFFSSTIKSQLEKKPITLYSLDQVLPILGLSELITQIVSLSTKKRSRSCELIRIPAKLMLTMEVYIEELEMFFGYTPQINLKKVESSTFATLIWPTELVHTTDIRREIRSIISSYVDFFTTAK